jgi:hypothetical protein
MDLDALYNVSQIDVTEAENNFSCLFNLDLKIGLDKKDEFKLASTGNSIYTVEDYLKYKKFFPIYKQQVKKFINWLKEALSQCEPGNVWKNNQEEYKQNSKETWNKNKELQQEYPNFEDFWETDQETYSGEYVNEDSIIQWNMFKDEFEEWNGDKLLEILGREFADRDFFSNYGQDLNRDRFDEALEETIEQIEELLNLEDEKLSPNERAERFFEQNIYQYPKCFEYYDNMDFQAIFKELFENEYEGL